MTTTKRRRRKRVRILNGVCLHFVQVVIWFVYIFQRMARKRKMIPISTPPRPKVSNRNANSSEWKWNESSMSPQETAGIFKSDKT